MQEESHRRGFVGIAIIGVLLGSIIMIFVPSKASESLIVQENQFPREIGGEPGVTDHQFILGLFTRRYLDQVELRYSFLMNDSSLNMSALNQRPETFGDLSDSIDEIAWLLSFTAYYPLDAEILDTDLVIEGKEYRGRVYDFTKFFVPSGDSVTSKEVLTTHLVLFDDDGKVLSYYKGIPDFVDESATGLELRCVTVSWGQKKEMYYAGDFSDEEGVKSIEERPKRGAIHFKDVGRASTLGVICDAEYQGGSADCLQLIRIYVNGKFDQMVGNPVTISW